MSEELNLTLDNLLRERSKYSQKPTKVQAINVRRELLNLKKVCDQERKSILLTVKEKPKKVYNRKPVEPLVIEQSDEPLIEQPVIIEPVIEPVVEKPVKKTQRKSSK